MLHQSTPRARRWIDGKRDGERGRYQCLHRRACSHTPCILGTNTQPRQSHPQSGHPQSTSAAAVDDALTAHPGALRRLQAQTAHKKTKSSLCTPSRAILAAARALHEHAIVRRLPVQAHTPHANLVSLGQFKPCRLHSRPQTYNCRRGVSLTHLHIQFGSPPGPPSHSAAACPPPSPPLAAPSSCTQLLSTCTYVPAHTSTCNACTRQNARFSFCFPSLSRPAHARARALTCTPTYTRPQQHATLTDALACFPPRDSPHHLPPLLPHCPYPFNFF